MSDTTAIAWTDATWNPVTGCSKVSPGCAHCYAETLSRRFGRSFDVTLHPDRLDLPLRWRKPRRVFVNSMSDLFHEQVPDAYIAHVWHVMANAYRHTFQVLTKRPERMHDWYRWYTFGYEPPIVLANVWLGTSIENDRFVGRADALRDTPAAVRFISAEPLLGPLPSLNLTGIDWLIVGGESGPGARPMDPEWVNDLAYAADLAGVALFVKQDSGARSGKQGRIPDWLWARKEYPR
jgi:protein gp37